jgi:hypothetical protein
MRIGRRARAHVKCSAVLLLALAVSYTAAARDMRLTIYDDGLACPGNCDAHFVMNIADNGTRYAFRPTSSRAKPKPCISGESCTICFNEADNSCMTALYRGSGPHSGTFDSTPAFYEANCSRADIPESLRLECRRLDAAVRHYGYEKRMNCFETPAAPRCKSVISKSKKSQEADAIKRRECLAFGEAAYNKRQTDPRDRRADKCNYSYLFLGGSGKNKWRLLLPGACRPGTYVDRFGLDCCNRDLRFVANVHPECDAFFPYPQLRVPNSR